MRRFSVALLVLAGGCTVVQPVEPERSTELPALTLNGEPAGLVEPAETATASVVFVLSWSQDIPSPCDVRVHWYDHDRQRRGYLYCNVPRNGRVAACGLAVGEQARVYLYLYPAGTIGCENAGSIGETLVYQEPRSYFQSARVTVTGTESMQEVTVHFGGYLSPPRRRRS